MGKAVATLAPSGAPRGVVVAPPRAVDAIGGALRNAFAHSGAMPPDMARMLAMIDTDVRAPCGRD